MILSLHVNCRKHELLEEDDVTHAVGINDLNAQWDELLNADAEDNEDMRERKDSINTRLANVKVCLMNIFVFVRFKSWYVEWPYSHRDDLVGYESVIGDL